MAGKYCRNQVIDKGNGVPGVRFRDKDFSTFFSQTKPTGQGTGWDYHFLMIMSRRTVESLV